MAQQCIYAPDRNQHGYSHSNWNRITETIPNKTPKKGEFTNIVRNLGTDDTRMVNVRDANGNRLFGDNIKNIEELNLTEKGVPINTVVKVTTPTGDKYFVSNKATKTEPSKWYLDENNGRLRAHTDWDAINPNITEFRKYTRDGDGLWREAQLGESGSFINIQNPVKGDVPQSRILKEGIDAIEIDGRYKLIEEETQAVNPLRVTEKPNRAATNMTRRTEPPSQTEVARRLVDEYNVPTALAYSVAGAVLGNMADEHNEHAGMFWGGALGMLLATPKVRTKIRGGFNRVTGKGKDRYDEKMHSVSEQERQVQRLERVKNNGFRGDVTDEQAVRDFELFINENEAKANRGESVFSGMFSNRYFESAFGLLSNMGERGKALLNVFRDFENAPTIMYSHFGRIQTRMFGDNAKQKFKQTQIDFIRDIPTFRELTDEDAIQAFGGATRRIRTYNARIEDGQFKYDQSSPARADYSNDIWLDLDRRILESEDAMRVVNTVEEYFREQGEQAISIINRQLSLELDKVGDLGARNLLDQVIASGKTFKQFRASNLALAQQLDLVRNGKYGDVSLASSHARDIKRIQGLYEDSLRFKSLQGNYIPQKMSTPKEGLERQRWERTNQGRLRELSPEEITEQWEIEKANRMLHLNRDKWTKLATSEDGLDADVVLYDSYDKARASLDVSVSEIQDATARDAIQTDLQRGNYSDYITGNAEQGYSLTTPEWVRTDPRFLDEHNRAISLYNNTDVVDKANKALTTFQVTSKANFFDRPRNVVIPNEFLENDMETLVKFYSDDMAIRLRSIDNGMYDQDAVTKNWLNPIREEVGTRFKDPNKLDRKIGEIKSWFSVMQGQRPERKIGLTEGDVETLRVQTRQKAQNDSFMNSLAKIATAAFNYGTTLYSMFTPAVFGPWITSYKSIGKEYMSGIFSPRQYARELRSFVDELEKMSIIQKKFESFAPEYKDMWKHDLLGDPEGWRRKFADFADNTTDFTSNLSLARIAKIDPDNMGLLRLAVGNMMDISGAEAGMVTMAAFRHVEDLLSIANQLKNSDQGFVMKGRTRYTQEMLNRQFNDLGITKIDDFVNGSEQFSRFGEAMRGHGDISSFDPKFYGEMVSFMNTVVDSYHGRTKLSRPVSWMDNVWGRALSRYSVYAQNFNQQTTVNRIYRPLRDWSDRYPMTNESVPLFKVAYYASTGNDRKFRELFGDNWEQAYNEFPVDAVNNFFKIFGTLAAGKAMMITRGGVLDLTEIATNEALGNDDYEAWRAVNRQLNIGVDDQGNDFTIADIFDGSVQGFDTYKMFLGGLGAVSQMGFGGRYAQIFTQDLQYPDGGIMDMTPVTQLPNDIFQRVGNTIYSPSSDLGRTAASELVDFTLLRGTPFGTFSGMRQGIHNTIIQKPENRNRTFRDISTGLELDAELYSF